MKGAQALPRAVLGTNARWPLSIVSLCLGRWVQRGPEILATGLVMGGVKQQPTEVPWAATRRCLSPGASGLSTGLGLSFGGSKST